MKVSELTTDFLADYIKVDKTIASETTFISAIKDSAISYVCEKTNLETYELDEHPDITLAVMMLVQDGYDHRCLYVDKSNISPVVKSILGIHSGGVLL